MIEEWQNDVEDVAVISDKMKAGIMMSVKRTKPVPIVVKFHPLSAASRGIESDTHR